MPVSPLIFVLERCFNLENVQESKENLPRREKYIFANRNIMKKREKYLPRIIHVLQYHYSKHRNKSVLDVFACSKLQMRWTHHIKTKRWHNRFMDGHFTNIRHPSTISAYNKKQCLTHSKTCSDQLISTIYIFTWSQRGNLMCCVFRVVTEPINHNTCWHGSGV